MTTRDTEHTARALEPLVRAAMLSGATAAIDQLLQLGDYSRANPDASMADCLTHILGDFPATFLSLRPQDVEDFLERLDP